MSKKNVMPMPSGGELLPKVIGTLVGLALLVVVIKHPSDAAEWLNGLVAMGEGAIDGIAAFFHQIAA